MLTEQLRTTLSTPSESHMVSGRVVFIFCTSSGHSVYADDALVASLMNVGPGGKHVLNMRNDWYIVGGAGRGGEGEVRKLDPFEPSLSL